ncbi:MAG: RNA-binding S4 domain-containing protein [Cyanobacteria bacterium P01_C01_bin.118]
MQEQFIKLSQFLKLNDLVQSGGEAKHLIQSGYVLVNDQVELRRGRKLYPGDRVTFAEQTYDVALNIEGIDGADGP